MSLRRAENCFMVCVFAEFVFVLERALDSLVVFIGFGGFGDPREESIH